MRRLVMLSFGFLIPGLMGCETPSEPHVPPDAVENSDAFIFGAGPAISIQKLTNGQDVNAPEDLSLTPGEPVVWEYRLTNTGEEDLTGVWVLDDKENVICTEITLLVGQEHTCWKEGIAEPGPYTNKGTVYGTGLYLPVEASDLSHYTGEASGNAEPLGQVVGIRIKPGDDFPCINASSRGRIPVSILSTPGFDLFDVDPSTILAGGLTSPVRWGWGEDVSGDGSPDLVVHFKTRDLKEDGLFDDEDDGGELMITGETFDGAAFTGFDMIRLAGGPFCGQGA